MTFAEAVKNPKGKEKHIAYDAAIRGKTLSELDPVEQAYFVRFYDVVNARERGYKIVTPEGDLSDWATNKDGIKTKPAFFDLPPIATAMRILAKPSKEMISVSMGKGPKRRNFSNNILPPNSIQVELTLDPHL